MFFGEQGLIGVIAFEGNAEKHLAFAVKKLAQGIHLVTPHGSSDIRISRIFSPVFTRSTTYCCMFGGVMPRRCRSSMCTIPESRQDMSPDSAQARVRGAAACQSSGSACARGLRMVRAKLWSPELRPASLANLERIASPD